MHPWERPMQQRAMIFRKGFAADEKEHDESEFLSLFLLSGLLFQRGFFLLRQITLRRSWPQFGITDTGAGARSSGRLFYTKIIQNGGETDGKTGVKLACKHVFPSVFASDEYPMLLGRRSRTRRCAVLKSAELGSERTYPEARFSHRMKMRRSEGCRARL